MITAQDRTVATPRPKPGVTPLRWQLSDLWRAPLADLPVRDELVRQFAAIAPEMDVLEIGPGNGFLSFRLARAIKALTLLEVAAGNAARLRTEFQKQSNIQVTVADICAPGIGEHNAEAFDTVLAIEVFELLPGPAEALRNMARMLRPGGELFLQFPNYEHAVWPTFYRSRAALDAQLRAAGFAQWTLYSLKLTPWAQWFFDWMHEFPLRLHRQWRKQERPKTTQNYDQTWAYHNAGPRNGRKLVIHLYWAAVMLAMRVGGAVFVRQEAGQEIFGKNLLVVAHKAGEASNEFGN